MCIIIVIEELGHPELLIFDKGDKNIQWGNGTEKVGPICAKK